MDRDKLEDLQMYGKIMEDSLSTMNVLAKLLGENVAVTRKYVKGFDEVVDDLVKKL